MPKLSLSIYRSIVLSIIYLSIYLSTYTYLPTYLQWGQKVFSQPLIVQVLLLRMMRD